MKLHERVMYEEEEAAIGLSTLRRVLQGVSFETSTSLCDYGRLAMEQELQNQGLPTTGYECEEGEKPLLI